MSRAKVFQPTILFHSSGNELPKKDNQAWEASCHAHSLENLGNSLSYELNVSRNLNQKLSELESYVECEYNLTTKQTGWKLRDLHRSLSSTQYFHYTDNISYGQQFDTLQFNKFNQMSTINVDKDWGSHQLSITLPPSMSDLNVWKGQSVNAETDQDSSKRFNFTSISKNFPPVEKMDTLPLKVSTTAPTTDHTSEVSPTRSSLIPGPRDVKVAKSVRLKKYGCPYCSVSCSNQGQLRGHIRKHTGEKPHVCSYDGCDKRFARNEELTRHKRIHTGSRPFKCSECNKHFGRRDHLKKHQKTHLNKELKNMFVCALCKEVCSRSDSLKRHFSITHPGLACLNIFLSHKD